MNDLIQLFFFTTRALIGQGRTVDASPVCDAQYNVLTHVFDANLHYDLVRMTLDDMGEVAFRNGALEEAGMRYLQLWRMRIQVHGPNVDHPDIASSLHHTEMVALLKGLLDEAEHCYRKAWIC